MPAIRQIQRRGWCPTTSITSVSLTVIRRRRSETLTVGKTHHKPWTPQIDRLLRKFGDADKTSPAANADFVCGPGCRLLLYPRFVFLTFQ